MFTRNLNFQLKMAANCLKITELQLKHLHFEGWLVPTYKIISDLDWHFSDIAFYSNAATIWHVCIYVILK